MIRRLIGILFLCLMLLPALQVRADIVTGTVVDAASGDSIAKALVQIEMSYGNGKSMSKTVTDSLGRFQFMGMNTNIKLTISALGYHDYTRYLVVGEGMDTLKLGKLKLKMSEILLGAAKVRAKAKKFTMKGDTVIFNPQAFDLSQGARLEELIKKLPGVTVEQGKLLWLGKPVRVLMEGEEFINNDLLMNRLPAEAVDKIKAYNKASEQKMRTGKEDGTEDYVLDLKIKPNWLQKWYGNAGAASMTGKRYHLSLDAMLLSKDDPLLVFGDMGTTGDLYVRKSFDMSGSVRGIPDLKGQTFSFGYQHKWSPSWKAYTRNNLSATGELNHRDQINRSWSSTETFLPDTERTFSLENNTNQTHNLAPTFTIVSRIGIDSITTFNFNTNISATKHRNTHHNLSSIFDANPAQYYSDSFEAQTVQPGDSLYRHLVTRNENNGFSKTESSQFSFNGEFQRYMDSKLSTILRLNVGTNYSDSKSKSRNYQAIDYVKSGDDSDLQNVLSKSRNHRFDQYVRLYCSKAINHGALSMEYTFHINDGMESRNRYLLHDLASYGSDYTDLNPDALINADSLRKVADLKNSQSNNYFNSNHSFRPQVLFTIKNSNFFLNMECVQQHRTTHFQQGSVDTTAARNDFYIVPMFDGRIRLGKSQNLNINYRYDTELPNLTSCIAYTDDSNPLYVVSGNPALRSSHRHNVQLNYSLMLPKKQLSLTAGLDYSAQSRPVQSVSHYNPTTGAYHVHSENVRGGWNIRPHLSFDQSFTNFRLTVPLYVRFNQSYAYTSSVTATSLPQLNSHRSLSLNFNPKLEFDKNQFNFSVSGLLNYTHTHNTIYNNDNPDLWDYEGKMGAKYTLFGFTLSTTFLLYGKSGYSIDIWNRPRLNWEARLERKVLKGKGLLALSANDILNQATALRGYQTAYSRSETRSNLLHNYVILSFSYQFDAKGDQKEE